MDSSSCAEGEPTVAVPGEYACRVVDDGTVRAPVKGNFMRNGPRLKSKAKGQHVARRQLAADPKSAHQKYEHYLALARAEAGNGDRVAAENYYQHAEHYLRCGTASDDLMPASP